jgi:hypothetical protein
MGTKPWMEQEKNIKQTNFVVGMQEKNYTTEGANIMMKKVAVDAYKFEKISSRMAKEFGTIPKGEEELHLFTLHAMESNLLKLHRQDPNRNGHHAIEAIQMSLLTVDGYLREIEYDFDRFAGAENQVFLHGLLMSFDPYTNQDIKEIVIENDPDFDAKEYFKLPVKCLLRIGKSIKLWTRELGRNGYFEFIEQQMGRTVAPDGKMNFSVPMKKGVIEKMEIPLPEHDLD